MTTIAQEVIESLESWEELSDAARMVAGDLDTGRFTLGDIANRCARVYGEGSIGKLATEIRAADKRTLYEYAQVSAHYDLCARAHYSELGMTFSHFKKALRAGDQAETWLDEAVKNDWPVAALDHAISAAMGKPVPPVKLWEGVGLLDIERIGASDYTGDHGHPEYVVILEADDMQLEMGQRVIVKVYAVGTGPSVEADEMAEAERE